MTTIAEKMRQKVGLLSSFQPTNNDRVTHELADVEAHSKLIVKLVKHVKELEKATDVMLKEAERAYTAQVPCEYMLEPVHQGSKGGVALANSPSAQAPGSPTCGSPTAGGPNSQPLLTVKSAIAVAVERPDAAQEHKAEGLQVLADARVTMEQRLRDEVFVPADKWLSDYEAAKGHAKEVEDARLTLDHARRVHADAELKKIKQEKNKGAASESVLAKLTNKDQSLENAKARFYDKEASTHAMLLDLILRAGLLRDAIAATFSTLHATAGRALAACPASSGAAPGTLEHQASSLKGSVMLPAVAQGNEEEEGEAGYTAFAANGGEKQQQLRGSGDAMVSAKSMLSDAAEAAGSPTKASSKRPPQLDVGAADEDLPEAPAHKHGASGAGVEAPLTPA